MTSMLHYKMEARAGYWRVGLEDHRGGRHPARPVAAFWFFDKDIAEKALTVAKIVTADGALKCLSWPAVAALEAQARRLRQGDLDHFTVTAVRPAPPIPRWEAQQYDGCHLVAFAPTEVQVDAHELLGFGLALTFLDSEARAGCEVICPWRVFDEVLRLARQPE
jgi:hypothetical protein